MNQDNIIDPLVKNAVIINFEAIYFKSSIIDYWYSKN